jgi:hypothetical protein
MLMSNDTETQLSKPLTPCTDTQEIHCLDGKASQQQTCHEVSIYQTGLSVDDAHGGRDNAYTRRGGALQHHVEHGQQKRDVRLEARGATFEKRRRRGGCGRGSGSCEDGGQLSHARQQTRTIRTCTSKLSCITGEG